MFIELLINLRMSNSTFLTLDIIMNVFLRVNINYLIHF